MIKISRVLATFAVLFLCFSAQSVFAATSFDESQASVVWANSEDEQYLGAFLTAGDFDGDGKSDVAIGAPYTDVTTSDEGEVYILNGSSTLRSTDALAATAADITISGETANEKLSEGNSRGMVSCNLNGDAYDDLLIPSSEGVYIFYGPSLTWNTTTLSEAVLIATANTPNGIACGDFNNDSFEDFATNAASDETLYVVYGGASELSDTDIVGASTYQITTEDVTSEFAYITAGDFDGDGNDDIAAADQANASDGTGTGSVNIFYGDTLSSGIDSFVGVEITATSSGSQFGYYLAAGDITSDGRAELFVRNPVSSTAVLIIPGSATRLTAASYDTLTTSQITSALMRFFVTSDVNGDGVNDLLIGGDSSSGNTDRAHIVYGAAGSLPSGTLSTVEDLLVEDDSAANTGFAENAVFADMNNDGHSELYSGAKNSAVTSSSADGKVYAYYFFVDSDSDGTYSDESLASSDADCDDFDSTASDLALFYADNDGDGLGNASDSASVCGAGAAPEGYIDENTDPNDNDFDNDGVETEDDCDDSDDTVATESTYYADVDDDGLGDPESAEDVCSASAPVGYANNPDDFPGEAASPFENADPADTTEYTANVVSVEGLSAGQILVNFSDSSSSTYQVFATLTATKKTKVLSYDGTGYLVVLHPQGKKIALVNVYTGVVLDTVGISKKKFPNRSLKLLDLRGDGSIEAVVTMKKGAKKLNGRFAIVKVNLTAETLTKKAAQNFESKQVRVGKTKKQKNKLLLRKKNNATVLAYKITKKYKAQLVFTLTPQ